MIKSLNKKDWLRHFLVWCFVVLHFSFFTSITGTTQSKMVWVFTLLLNFAFAFYVLLFIIWPRLIEGKKAIMILLFILLTTCFIGVYCYQVEVLIPNLGGRLIVTGKPFTLKTKKFLMNYSFVVFSSLGTYFNRRAINETRLALSKENAMFSRELLFLKNQFHSHLTFNFFNFCYNRVRKHSKETAAAIEEFSDLLRYSLKYKAEDLVNLKDEIEYIRSYINFQKYLISDTYIDFECSGTDEGMLIIPRTLILVIESLIKNILVNDAQKPAAISLTVLTSELILKVKGKKVDNQVNVTSVEINNIINVFEILYYNQYKLNVKEINLMDVEYTLKIKYERK